METNDFSIMSADDLRLYMRNHQEKEYILIDVRQPQEYSTSHLPGAKHIPLQNIVNDFSEIPDDKDLIFYCASGARSRMAAMLVSEGSVTNRDLFNLNGGIMSWSGKTLEEVPRVRTFDRAKTLPQFLETVMNMEKGAGKLYQKICDMYLPESFSQTFKTLASVELSHAKMIYLVYMKVTDTLPSSFESLYDQLDGDIIEGGESLETFLEIMSDTPQNNSCLFLMELSLGIEYAAYDLYRTLANQKTDDPEMAGIFLDIAQAEKGHMRMIADAIEKCSL